MAFGNATFSDISGGISDFFAASADKAKAAGDIAEQQNYQLAGQLANTEDTYTQWSTAIKGMQADREIYQGASREQADVAGAGFAQSGSSLDLLRDSAAQGALQKQVLSEQGLITEAGYKEQSQSYTNMANAAGAAASAENTASTGSLIAGGVKAAAGIATLFA